MDREPLRGSCVGLASIVRISIFDASDDIVSYSILKACTYCPTRLGIAIGAIEGRVGAGEKGILVVTHCHTASNIGQEAIPSISDAGSGRAEPRQLALAVVPGEHAATDHVINIFPGN